MNNIQIQGVDSTFRQVVVEDVQYLKQHLDSILTSSDQTLIENLIQETEFRLEQARNTSETYREKYEIFNQLTQSWFGLWNHYKDTPEAIELIRLIDHLTNNFIAYSYLCLGLALINEGRSDDDKTDLERVVQGFLLLSEVIDVFVNSFSVGELKQIYNGARNTILDSGRSPGEYFQEKELSNLVTQLRAYSSLIMLRIEQYIKNLGLTLEIELLNSQNGIENNSDSSPWWEQITGTFANNAAYDEAMRLGREYRNSLR